MAGLARSDIELRKGERVGIGSGVGVAAVGVGMFEGVRVKDGCIPGVGVPEEPHAASTSMISTSGAQSVLRANLLVS